MRRIVLHTVVVVFAVGTLLVRSCNENLLRDIEQPDALIVVDGWIEQGRQAKVFLTTNAPYFTSIDSASIRELVLSRAKVTLSDGDTSEVLILRKDLSYFPPFYYQGNTMIGETGKHYTLTAEYGGKSAEAVTTIPAEVAIDTAYFERLAGEDSLGVLKLVFTDPSEEKNYYRIFTQRKGSDDRFVPSVLMAINDRYFSGEQLTFTVSRPPASLVSSEGNEYFEAGDTILVKLCTMDEASFSFWSSYQEEVMNATNPFASSMNNLESNIWGDGLGVWSGYGVTVYTVIAR
jgi:hypothetical protein